MLACARERSEQKMIEDLCKKLKDKRKKLGYDLEDVVEGTKLHPSVIKAIEDCRLSDISPVYLKGFIKLYASFLDVGIGDELNSIFPAKIPHKINRPRKDPGNKINLYFINRLTFKIKRNILFASVLFVSFIIIFMLILSIVRLVKYKSSPNIKNSGRLKNVNPEVLMSNKNKGVVVSIKVKRECFIKTKRDGKVVFKGVLKKGVVEKWQARKELEFSINDGSSVVVEVDGRILPPLSKIYKPIKSLKITPKGISIVK